MGGVNLDNSPPSFKSIDEIFFDIVNVLCERFQGLSPFEVLNTEIEEVFDLYVDCVIHDVKEKKKGNNNEEVWVTSKNATWH